MDNWKDVSTGNEESEKVSNGKVQSLKVFFQSQDVLSKDERTTTQCNVNHIHPKTIGAIRSELKMLTDIQGKSAIVDPLRNSEEKIEEIQRPPRAPKKVKTLPQQPNFDAPVVDHVNERLTRLRFFDNANGEKPIPKPRKRANENKRNNLNDSTRHSERPLPHPLNIERNSSQQDQNLSTQSCFAKSFNIQINNDSTQSVISMLSVSNTNPNKLHNSKNRLSTFIKRKLLCSKHRIECDNEQYCDAKIKSRNRSSLVTTSNLKPTRKPPTPPKLVFRPAAPLPGKCQNEPEQDLYEDITGEELYNDMKTNDERSENYCSAADNFYQVINDYDDAIAQHQSSINEEEEIYQDAQFESEGIYEVLPFELDELLETDYLKDNHPKNSSHLTQIPTRKTRIDKKREAENSKLKKKYNLSGSEVPINAGTVKEDAKATRFDLEVKKGETVLILRMEDNPPGISSCKPKIVDDISCFFRQMDCKK